LFNGSDATRPDFVLSIVYDTAEANIPSDKTPNDDNNIEAKRTVRSRLPKTELQFILRNFIYNGIITTWSMWIY